MPCLRAARMAGPRPSCPPTGGQSQLFGAGLEVALVASALSKDCGQVFGTAVDFDEGVIFDGSVGSDDVEVRFDPLGAVPTRELPPALIFPVEFEQVEASVSGGFPKLHGQGCDVERMVGERPAGFEKSAPDAVAALCCAVLEGVVRRPPRVANNAGRCGQCTQASHGRMSPTRRSAVCHAFGICRQAAARARAAVT